jgi:adenylate cyclase
MTAKDCSNASPLPSGTVTFLFTDIEGSSRLWETQHDAMQASLARHDALVRGCIEAHGGHVVKTLGDGFLAAFASASGAVKAALAAQQALHAEAWPKPATIRVRMAVHTGAAEIRDGDYFGPALNRVARLVAIGHGGQTLLSATTHDLCCDHLPPEVSLRPLGEHNLKSLARRELVFQLCHPSLPRTFPPLRTLLAPLDQETPSIAVLPFVNMSRDEDNEYFADGLAEELLNVLSKIRGLRVASRTSAFSFKGTKVDIPTIAQRLNVATILEGSVRKAGKRVRITAQLIQVATDSHLWSDTYDRELEDIFAVQDDIAQSVVKELRRALLDEKPDRSAIAQVKAEVSAAVIGRTEDLRAHQLYLQGRFLCERLTRDDTAKGVGYYRQALESDPHYALAWTGLAGAYSNQAGFGWGPLAESFDRARAAAHRSLELEPDLAEGHAELGWVRMTYDWDWAGADACYARALELAPGSRDVVSAASLLADNVGRTDEAVALARRASALDPLSVATQGNLGLRCLNAGLLDEADAALNQAIKLSPQGGLVHWALGILRLEQGRLPDALAAFEREELDSLRVLGLALVQHARGRGEESDAALRELIDKTAETSAFQIAEAHAYRGETDRAFEWLERAYAQRDPGLTQMKRLPLFRKLHGDPRWQPFLAKMGLADRA